MFDKYETKLVEQWLVEIRHLIFDDFPQGHQHAMVGSPAEVVGCALEWIRKRASSKVDSTSANNRSDEICDIIDNENICAYCSINEDGGWSICSKCKANNYNGFVGRKLRTVR